MFTIQMIITESLNNLKFRTIEIKLNTKTKRLIYKWE